MTRDGGESWARTTSKDWVVNSLVVLDDKNGGADRVVLGTEGQGVQVSDDAGVSFAEANRGFTHVTVKQLVADEFNAGHFLMVVERTTSEIQESRDGGKNWTSLAWGLNIAEGKGLPARGAGWSGSTTGGCGYGKKARNRGGNGSSCRAKARQHHQSNTKSLRKCSRVITGCRHRVFAKGCPDNIHERRLAPLPGIRELYRCQSVWPCGENSCRLDLGFRPRDSRSERRKDRMVFRRRRDRSLDGPSSARGPSLVAGYHPIGFRGNGLPGHE